MEDRPNTPNPIGYTSGDDYQIDRGLAEAEQDERLIDDATARRAAGQLHEGQYSALYSLASSGAVDQEALEAEISRGAEAPDADERMKRIYRHLGSYVAQHAGRGPVDGWYKLTEDINVADAERDEVNEPRVWIGCLASYNDGELHGRWIAAAREEDELKEDVRRILASSSIEDAEEYYIADTDNFYGLSIGDYTDLSLISRLAKGIVEQGESFARWVGHHGIDNFDHAEETFEDAYAGTFEDEQAAAMDLMESAGVFEAMETAHNQVSDTYKDFMIVDVDGFAMQQPDCTMLRGTDGQVFAFRDV